MCSMLNFRKNIIFICSVIHCDAAHYILKVWIIYRAIFFGIFNLYISTLRKIYFSKFSIKSTYVSFPECTIARNTKNMALTLIMIMNSVVRISAKSLSAEPMRPQPSGSSAAAQAR